MNISAKTRDMPVSYQDFVLYSQATGAPLPRNAQERMQMAPEVYTFTRQIGGRPSGIRQGLSAVGRGLAVLGGAGVAVGVANSLFNKPSDNYRQAVTNNQTTIGKEARKATQTTFDDSYTTGGENYTGQGPDEGSAPVSKSVAPSITAKTDQYLDGIGPDPVGASQYVDSVGPHSLASATGIGRKPRMAKLADREFSQALRYGDPAANVAAVQDENMRARWGLQGPLSEVKGVYGPVDRSKVGGQHGMSLTEEEAFRLKTGQSRSTYGNTPKTKEERRYQYKNPLIIN